MGSTAFLLGVTALVVCKIATRIGVNAGHFEGLPRPTQIDRIRPSAIGRRPPSTTWVLLTVAHVCS